MKVILGVALVVMLASCENSEKDLLEKLGKTASAYIEKEEFKRKEKFFCPTSPYYFETDPPKERNCTSFFDCLTEKDTLCCYWSSSSTHHCLKGIEKTTHAGECPTPNQFNDACLADYSGCRADSQCQETEKCCAGLCGYNECLDVRQNIDCPHNFVPELNAQECETSAACKLDEKCCSSPTGSYCGLAVSKLPKAGWCQWKPDRNDCRVDYAGECNWDSECNGHDKCCHNGCHYPECVKHDPIVSGDHEKPPPVPETMAKKSVAAKKVVAEKKEIKKKENNFDILKELVKRLEKLGDKA